jgi:hypothetical protein
VRLGNCPFSRSVMLLGGDGAPHDNGCRKDYRRGFGAQAADTRDAANPSCAGDDPGDEADRDARAGMAARRRVALRSTARRASSEVCRGLLLDGARGVSSL